MKSTLITSFLLAALSTATVLAQTQAPQCDVRELCKSAIDTHQQCKGRALDQVRAATNNSKAVDWFKANGTLLAPFGDCYCEYLRATEGECNECLRTLSASSPGSDPKEDDETFEFMGSLTDECKRGAVDAVTKRALLIFQKDMATYDANNVTDSKDLASRPVLNPIRFPSSLTATATAAAPTATATSAASAKAQTPTPTSAAVRLDDGSKWAVGVSVLVAGMLFG